jgi:hypothetical protein
MAFREQGCVYREDGGGVEVVNLKNRNIIFLWF